MKLFNRTYIPDSIINAVVQSAAAGMTFSKEYYFKLCHYNPAKKETKINSPSCEEMWNSHCQKSTGNITDVIPLRTENVVVQINEAVGGCGGEARNRKIAILCTSRNRKEGVKRITTDCGWFIARLRVATGPRIGTSRQRIREHSVEIATSLWKTCQHEWWHIFEYQLMDAGILLPFDRFKAAQEGRRRTWHRYRPEEIRVHEAMDKLQSSGHSVDDEPNLSAIINLADALERIY